MLFDKKYKAILRDEFGERDISDELNSLATIELSLDRIDFQMLPANCKGIDNVIEQTRDRIIARYLNGADLDNPAFIDLYKENELISTQTIDDLTYKINQNYASFEIKEKSLWNKIVSDKDTKFSVEANCTLKDNVRVYAFRNFSSSAGNGISRYTYTGNNYGAYILPIEQLDGTAGLPIVTMDEEKFSTGELRKRFWYRNTEDGLEAMEMPASTIFCPKFQQIEFEFTCPTSYDIHGETFYGATNIIGAGGLDGYNRKTISIWLRGYNDTDGIYDIGKVTNVSGGQQIGNSADRKYTVPEFSGIRITTPYTFEESYFWLELRGLNGEQLPVGHDDIEVGIGITEDYAYGASYHGVSQQGKNIMIRATNIAGSKALIDGVPACTIQNAVNQVLLQIEPSSFVLWDLDLMSISIDRRWTELLVNPAAFDLSSKTTEEAKRTLKLSIFELFKTLDVDYCIGIEELPNNILRISDRRNIIRTSVKSEVTDYADLQIEVDTSKFYNKLSAGSEKGVDKDTQGRQDFHGLVDYLIPKTRERDTVYDIKQIYYTNPLGISNYLVERNNETEEDKEDEKDNPKDTDVFVFCGWLAGGSNIIPYNDSTFYIYKSTTSTEFSRPDLVNIIAPTLSEYSTEIYNAPISPLRTIERHANFLSGVLRYFRNPAIYKKAETKITDDFEISTGLVLVEREVRNEKPEEIPFTNAEPFTLPIKVSCQTDLSFSDKLQFINRNNPISIQTDLLDQSEYVFFPQNNEILITPIGVSFNFVEEAAISEVSGQQITDSEENYYLTQICKEDIL